jgi:hypothetical protein
MTPAMFVGGKKRKNPSRKRWSNWIEITFKTQLSKNQLVKPKALASAAASAVAHFFTALFSLSK